MIMTIPCGLANIFVTTSLSLALPSAQCDLNLTIFDKGLLNSGIYIGKYFIDEFMYLIKTIEFFF